MLNVTPEHLHFRIPIEHQKQRFREAIMYVSKKSQEDQHFGAIKLNKILYYSDFLSFERLGRPITGVEYFRLDMGPAPKVLIPVRKELIAEGSLRLERVQVGPFLQDRTVALREPVLSHFSSDEISIIDQVIENLWNQNASEVSDASHDVRWRTLRDRELLPYEFAYLDDQITEDDKAKTKLLAIELGWQWVGK